MAERVTTHVGAVLGAAAVSAVVAGVAAGISESLATTGKIAVTASATLAGSLISFMVVDRRAMPVVAALLAVSIGGGLGAVSRYRVTPDQTGVIRFVGGCAAFRVFAQNRWYPYGAAVRTAPLITAKQIASRDPNQSLSVNGWVHSDVAYPTNRPPWNSDVWYHLADGAGWVSFAGVRATPVTRDPSGLGPGGPPPPIDPHCQGEAQ